MKYIIYLLLAFTFICIVIVSNTIESHTTTEIRRGIEYDVTHYEWHWENFAQYIKQLPKNALRVWVRLIEKFKKCQKQSI